MGDPRRDEQAGGGQVFTLIPGPQWGLVGSSGLGGLNMEGPEGFWVLPGPWEPSHQAPRPANMPLHTGCPLLCAASVTLSPTVAPVHADSAPGDSE